MKLKHVALSFAYNIVSGLRWFTEELLLGLDKLHLILLNKLVPAPVDISPVVPTPPVTPEPTTEVPPSDTPTQAS